MQRKLVPSFAALIVILTASLPAAASEEAGDRLREYMKACVEVHQFNGSVLVVKNERTLLSEGYGYADFEHEVRNTPATRFRIGSLTKAFTALAVMLLEEKGELSVDDPPARHLPEAPPAWEDVTIHHLLTHTSGIPSYTDMFDYRRDMMLPQTKDQMLARFNDKPLQFAPGEQFRYSNSGYFLLGVLIENASGQPYDEFLRQDVFEPLGMDDSGYDRHATVLKHRADGYERLAGELVHAPYLDMSQPYSAGALYSTVEDLGRWDRALREQKLLSPEGYERLLRPDKDSYAYGWHVGKQGGRRRVSHGGGINGFSSYLLRIPDEELCVVVLSNVQPANAPKMADDLAAIALGEKYQLPKARKFTKVDPQILDAYRGKYELRPDFIVTVTCEGDDLVAQATGQPKFVMLPESETVFFIEVVDAQVTFVKNEEGQVTGLVLYQGGQEIQAKRIDEPR